MPGASLRLMKKEERMRLANELASAALNILEPAKDVVWSEAWSKRRKSLKQKLAERFDSTLQNVLKPKIIWHWDDSKDGFSNCPLVFAGHWSTDSQVLRVNCKLCLRRKTYRTALAAYEARKRKHVPLLRR